MSKNTNNINRNLCCMAMVACLILSCNNNRQHIGVAKLVTQKMPDGSIKVLGAIIDGKKEGMWVKYDDSGRISSNYTYVNDSLIGEEISYWGNGKISSRRHLQGDEIQGEWVGYYDYDKNKIAERGSYKDGNKIGIWEYYLEDGRLNKKVEYTTTGEKIILNNHLMPEIPSIIKLSPVDRNNRAYIIDSNGKEVNH